MLVLSRRRDESIMLGDNIEIIVVDIQHGKIQLGISAPSRVPVYRKEIYERIREEKTGRRKGNLKLYPRQRDGILVET